MKIFISMAPQPSNTERVKSAGLGIVETIKVNRPLKYKSLYAF